MTAWRFDQGRLDYFHVDQIRKIARGILELNGTRKPVGDDPDTVRKILSKHTELPFSPDHYFVWRNYGRVFQTMLLCAIDKGYIVATDVCKQLVHSPVEEFDPNDYLTYFSTHFYYPAPFFDHYDPLAKQVFPAVAIIKLLIAKYLSENKSELSIEEIVSYLVANDVTGLEDQAFFEKLRPRKAIDADSRQIRELVEVISQFSFLKWQNPSLELDVFDPRQLLEIFEALTPVVRPRRLDPAKEVLQMGGGKVAGQLKGLTAGHDEDSVDEFTEGKKIRITHLRTERSAKLKAHYFKEIQNAHICDMCQMDTRKRYPWAHHVIELHHLLPLSSPVRVENATSSLADLVGLCPTCHSATHRFYAAWLKGKGQPDFKDYQEARKVYESARKNFIK